MTAEAAHQSPFHDTLLFPGVAGRREGLEKPFLDFVLAHLEANGAHEAEPLEELGLVLHTRTGDHMHPVGANVAVGVEVTRQLNVRSFVARHGFEAFLLLVRQRVGVAASRVKHVQAHFLGHDDVVRILPQVHDVVAPFDVLALVVKSVRHQREAVDLAGRVGIIVVASDDVGRDAFALRVVLDDVLGLRLVAVALHEVDVVTVLVPAIAQVTRVEHGRDAERGEGRVRFFHHIEPLGNRAEVRIGNEPEGTFERHDAGEVGLVAVPGRPIGEPVAVVELAEAEVRPHFAYRRDGGGEFC